MAIEPTRVCRTEDAGSFLEEAGLDVEAFGAEIEGRFISPLARGRKPGA